MNNPYRSNIAGPGAVPREGIAGLDPINGLPFTWDPGPRPRRGNVRHRRERPDGLFVGSDTDQFGGETHRKIAFLPLAGGTVVPTEHPVRPARTTCTGSTTATGTSLAALVRRHDVRPATTLNTGVNWATTRGAFALNGRIYTGQSNGTLTVPELQRHDGRRLEHVEPLRTADGRAGDNFLIPGTNTPVPGVQHAPRAR